MKYQVVSHPADNGGCGHYRMKYPVWAAQTLSKEICVVESMKVIPIPGFYKDVRMVRIQRQLSDVQCQYILNFLKPLSERFGFWLCYEIDDVVGKDDIPLYNSGWQAFQNPKLMQNMKLILQLCDILTVTTPELGNYYHRKFGVSKDNIYIVPNYLPRWWIGDSYNVGAIEDKIKKMEKPKIGFVSSATHFDVFDRNEGVDDFTHIVDLIRNTVDKYDWVFIGGCPKQLKDLAGEKKISFHPGFDILNYPHVINSMNFHLMVAPLIDNVFNRCKSNIKFLECSALGIPCICQNLPTYRPYTDLLFMDTNELQDQIDGLLGSIERYMDVVKANRNVIDHGNELAPRGWWLEKNMDKWLKLFCINQKVLRFDLSKLDAAEEEKKQLSEGIEEIKFEV